MITKAGGHILFKSGTAVDLRFAQPDVDNRIIATIRAIIIVPVFVYIITFQ